MFKIESTGLIAALALGAALLAGCTKAPDAPPAAPAATVAPAAQPQAPSAAPAASQPAAAGNPDAIKDPVFNMPAAPVMDVAKAKGEYEKIVSESLK